MVKMSVNTSIEARHGCPASEHDLSTRTSTSVNLNCPLVLITVCCPPLWFRVGFQISRLVVKMSTILVRKIIIAANFVSVLMFSLHLVDP